MVRVVSGAGMWGSGGMRGEEVICQPKMKLVNAGECSIFPQFKPLRFKNPEVEKDFLKIGQFWRN